MKSDKILFNGNVMEAGAAVDDYNAVVSRNYSCQDIVVGGGKVLHLADHYSLIAQGLAHKPHFTANELEKGITTLLAENRYPAAGWALVRLYATAQDWVVAPVKGLLYNYMTLWHARPRAITVHYGQAFGFACASTLTAASGAAEMARISGVDVAIREDERGVMCGVGLYPLFCVKDGICYTTSIFNGAIDSVPRRWAMALIKSCSVELIEQDCLADDIALCEMFVATPQGITSLMSLAGRPLFCSIATILAAKLGAPLPR